MLRAEIRDNLPAARYVAALYGLSWLPPRLAFRLAGQIGQRTWMRQRDRLEPRVMMTALQLGAKSEDAREWLRVACHWRACEHLEHWLYRRWTKENLSGYVEIRGREHLDAALEGGRGAILTSGHFNSVVSMMVAVSVLGYPETVIRPARIPKRLNSRIERSFHSRWLNLFEGRLKGRFLWTEPPSPLIAAHALKALRRNEVVTTLVDLWNTTQTVDVELLGMSVAFPQGTGQLALASGAPILFARLSRPPSLHPLVITIEPPVPTGTCLQEIAERQVAVLEAAIRDDPPAWSSMLFRV